MAICTCNCREFDGNQTGVGMEPQCFWVHVVARARNSYCSHGLGCGFERETDTIDTLRSIFEQR